MKYASVVKRIIAISIDLYLIFNLEIFIELFISKIWYLLAFKYLMVFVYLPLCWCFFNGSSLGNYLLFIRVKDLDGQSLKFKISFLRMFSLIISFLFFIVSIPMMLISERKQSLHDRVSNSVVIDLNSV